MYAFIGRSVFNGTFGNTSELVVVMNNTTPSLLTETELQQSCDDLRISETDLDQNTLLFCGVCGMYNTNVVV